MYICVYNKQIFLPLVNEKYCLFFFLYSKFQFSLAMQRRADRAREGSKKGHRRRVQVTGTNEVITHPTDPSVNILYMDMH